MSTSFEYIGVVTTLGRKLGPKPDFDRSAMNFRKAGNYLAASVRVSENTPDGTKYHLLPFTMKEVTKLLKELSATREAFVLAGDPNRRNETDETIQEFLKARNGLIAAQMVLSIPVRKIA